MDLLYRTFGSSKPIAKLPKTAYSWGLGWGRSLAICFLFMLPIKQPPQHSLIGYILFVFWLMEFKSRE